MNITTYILTGLACLGLYSGSQAQSSPFQELKVGDQMIDLPLNSMLNYPAPHARLSDFKGKVVLLDFWNIGCSASVADFTKLEALQKQFGDRIQIVRITRSSEEQVKNLFQRSPLARNSRLPLVVGDTSFTKWFPIKLPHQAWIDRDGVVRAVSSSVNATPENVHSLLSGGTFHLLPIAHNEGFNPNKPMFQDGLVPFEEAEQFSFITHYINGINYRSGHTLDTATGKVIRRAYYNMSVKHLLKFAFGGVGDNLFGIPSDDRKIIYVGKDPARFYVPNDPNRMTEWVWKNTYCYEIQVAPENAHKLAVYMQQDLQRYFNMVVQVEKRKVKGFALVKGKGNHDFKTKGGGSLTSFNTLDQTHILRNQPISELVSVLGINMDSSIVVDYTGIEGNFDMKIKSTKDVKELRKQLAAYGLDLIERVVETSMLVIGDQ